MPKLDNRFVPQHQFKNKIINGGFDVWQRGTSHTASGFTADRWELTRGGTGVITGSVTREASIVGEDDFNFFIRHGFDYTGASTADTIIAIRQKKEGVETLQGKEVTLSFKARGSVAGDISLGIIQDFGTGGSPSAATAQPFGLTLSTEWQTFSFSFTLPSTVGKTLGSDDNDSVIINFYKKIGTDYSDYIATFYTGDIDIANVQLEEGSVATDFEQRPLSVEEMLCKRYYWQPPQYESNSFNFRVLGNIYSGSYAATGSIIFPTIMRDYPTITTTDILYATTTASYSGSLYSVSSEFGSTVMTIDLPTAQIIGDVCRIWFNLTVDAEL